jgi:hypothetical protein
VAAGVAWENLRKGDHYEDTCVDERIILKWIFKEIECGTCPELIWLRTGTSGGLL